jgi:hypothetical protein
VETPDSEAVKYIDKQLMNILSENVEEKSQTVRAYINVLQRANNDNNSNKKSKKRKVDDCTNSESGCDEKEDLQHNIPSGSRRVLYDFSRRALVPGHDRAILGMRLQAHSQHLLSKALHRR